MSDEDISSPTPDAPGREGEPERRVSAPAQPRRAQPSRGRVRSGGRPAGNADRRPAASKTRNGRHSNQGAQRAAMKPMRKRRAGCLAVLALAFVVLGGGTVGVWSFLFAPSVSAQPGQPVQIDIPKGSGSADISVLLANSGVVTNPNMFRLKLRTPGTSGTLKAGTYDLTTGMDYDVVIAQLREGPPIEYVTVTIPEGYTIEQTAKRVEEKTGISAAGFLDLAETGAKRFEYSFLKDIPGESLEGYLFPKTYRVRVGSNARDVIDLMLRQFAKETSGLDLSYAAERGLTLRDVVTIASMIERETCVQSDRPLVSSVIYNRLSKGMLLEIDATVQYVVGNKPRLLYKDLRVDSPYNTYRNRGLPPGPIASPGALSLEAAAAPAQTGYLYYVLTGKDGSHSFAATGVEFAKLKAEAKKGLK